MPGPTGFDQKVYASLAKPDFLPNEFKTWLPKYLRYLSGLQISKGQIPGVMGENWHYVGANNEPAFIGTYVNYGSPYVSARFYRDYLGIVHISGRIKNATSLSGVQLMFTLPPGYAPDAALTFGNPAAYGAAAASLAQVEVAASGDVSLVYPSAQTLAWLSLSNIHYRAA